MKKKLLLAGAFCAAASMAQAAPTLYEFYLFRADGAVHTIANADVDSITFERADTEGNPTEAFATQVIHLKDGTKLRTAFANISDVCLADPVSQPADSVVDLGLSVGWRTCNIGATTTADYGDLVGWGDPTGKHHEQYHTSNYGAYNRNKNTCLEYYGGITPPDDISGTEYDIARTQLGGEWRMPTLAEMTELKDKTKSLWMTYRGAEGVLLEGPSGARIFMPAAGRRRGETMESLSYLASLVANRLEGDYIKLGLDVAGYRDKRESDLTALAQRIGTKVRRTGRSFAMEPMNPYERRIIHSAIGKMEGVRSESKGEGRDRRVVIYSTAPDAQTENTYGERRGRGGNRNGRRPGGNRNGGYRGERRSNGGYRGNRSGAPRGPRPSSVPERTYAPRDAESAAPVAPKRTERVDDFADFSFGKIEL